MTVCLVGTELGGLAARLAQVGLDTTSYPMDDAPKEAIAAARYLVVRYQLGADDTEALARDRVLTLAAHYQIPVALVFDRLTPAAVDVVLDASAEIHLAVDEARLRSFDLAAIVETLDRADQSPRGIAIGSRHAMPADHDAYEANRGLSLVSPRMWRFIMELRGAIRQMRRPPLQIPWDPTNTQPPIPEETKQQGSNARIPHPPNLQDIIDDSHLEWTIPYLTQPESDAARAWAVLPPPLLILGESGTGKSLVARTVHERLWPHDGEPAHPFVEIGCASLGVENFEHEMFGARKDYWDRAHGVGHLARATYGTAFLDEIGDMRLGAQAALLTFFNHLMVTPSGGRPFFGFTQIVAATNRDLDARIALGAFRHDLSARFRARVTLPPLRERGDDELRDMIDFVAQNPDVNPLDDRDDIGRVVSHISEPAIDALLAHEYRDANFRELEEILYAGLWRARRSGSKTLDVEHLLLKPSARRADADERIIAVQALPIPDDHEPVVVDSLTELTRLAELSGAAVLRDPQGRTTVEHHRVWYVAHPDDPPSTSV